jgi:hypothetical protein
VHARISTVKVWPGTWTEYEIKSERRVIESKPHASGRRAVLLIRSIEEADTGISFSLWDSSEAMFAYESSAWHHTRMLPVNEQYMPGEIPVGHGQVRFWYDHSEGWRIREKKHSASDG